MIITILLDTVAVDTMNCSRRLNKIQENILEQGDGQAGGEIWTLKSHLEEVDVASAWLQLEVAVSIIRKAVRM